MYTCVYPALWCPLAITELCAQVTAEGNYTVQPEPCAFDLKHFAGDEAFPPGMASTERVEWHYQACGRIVSAISIMLSGHPCGMPFCRAWGDPMPSASAFCILTYS